MATKTKKPLAVKNDEVMTIREQEFNRQWKWGLETAANIIHDRKGDGHYSEFIAQTIDTILDGYPTNPIYALTHGYDDSLKPFIRTMMELKADPTQIGEMLVFEIEHLAMREVRELAIANFNNPSYHRLLHAIKEIEKHHTENPCEVNRLTRWALGDPRYADVVYGWHPYNDENGEYVFENLTEEKYEEGE